MIIAKLHDHYKTVDPAQWAYRSFLPHEIACKHCGELLENIDALTKLQALREDMNRPIVLNSAYRCPTHNARLPRASPNSLHKLGRAFDIRTRGWSRQEHAALLVAAGRIFAGGIGVYTTFVHVDNGPNRRW